MLKSQNSTVCALGFHGSRKEHTVEAKSSSNWTRWSEFENLKLEQTNGAVFSNKKKKKFDALRPTLSPFCAVCKRRMRSVSNRSGQAEGVENRGGRRWIGEPMQESRSSRECRKALQQILLLVWVEN